MVADANDPPETTPIFEKLYLETPDLTTTKGIVSEEESDDEDADQSPNWSQKWSSVRLVNKRSSPMRIYTYKVDFLVDLSKILISFKKVKSEFSKRT